MLKKITRQIFLIIAYGLVFTLLGGIVTYIVILESRPDLDPWHTVELKKEFSADRHKKIETLAQYQQVENDVFRELVQRIYAKNTRQVTYNRFNPGSPSDPVAYLKNWNRTHEFTPETIRGGALMLHGLSDSPYSMRALSELLRDQGIYVLALRLPGHGTAPSGLVHARWEDFAAATRIGVRHVRSRIGPRLPLYIVGYSNGAALAVEHSLVALTDDDLALPDGLVLVSPAIGVSPVAVLAKWQSRLAAVPIFNKLAWNSIELEFDPYKYNSFAVNAGDQIYQLTERIADLFDSVADQPELQRFPPVLAFQSVVDATIPPHSLIERLLRRLPAGRAELVLFDVNRNAEAEAFLIKDPEDLTEALLRDPGLPFGLTLVTNESPESRRVHVLQKAASAKEVIAQRRVEQWPNGVYSLSHVALPFPPDDPLYGAVPDTSETGLYLGKIELQGERGILQISPGQFIRLRHNPFYGYLTERVRAFLPGPGGGQK